MKQLTDEDLLNFIVRAAGRLLTASHAQHAGTFGSVTDDDRWPFPVPLRFEIQLGYLMTGALDAFDVAIASLGKRASQQALGAIRFQTETLVTLRWLMEPEDPRERLKRSYRLLNGLLSRTRHLLRDVPRDDPDAMPILKQGVDMEAALQRIAREDGFQTLREAPDRSYLFGQYLGAYSTFGALSELGSHPGVLGHLLFAHRSDSRVEMDVSAGVVERAFWAGVSYEVFQLTLVPMGQARHWEEWLDATALPLVNETQPALLEARERWTASRQP